MSGETNLGILLKSMAPALQAGEYVFCTFPDANYGDHAHMEPIASYREREGLTLVVPRENADANGIDYDSVFRAITLNVHSSLDAVGLTAAISGALSEQGISANVVAGYYHDHLFVQREAAALAVEVLQELADSKA